MTSKPLLFSSETTIFRNSHHAFVRSPQLFSLKSHIYIYFFFISFGNTFSNYSAYFWLFSYIYSIIWLFLELFFFPLIIMRFFSCFNFHLSKNAFHSFPRSYGHSCTRIWLLWTFCHFFKINHSLQFYIELCDLTILVFFSCLFLMFLFSFLLAFSLFFPLYFFQAYVPW